MTNALPLPYNIWHFPLWIAVRLIDIGCLSFIYYYLCVAERKYPASKAENNVKESKVRISLAALMFIVIVLMRFFYPERIFSALGFSLVFGEFFYLVSSRVMISGTNRQERRNWISLSIFDIEAFISIALSFLLIDIEFSPLLDYRIGLFQLFG